MRRMRVLAVLAAGILATASLAGCGGGALTPELVLVNGGEPPYPLIPTSTNDSNGGRILDRIFAGLVSYDAAGNPSDEVAQSIANLKAAGATAPSTQVSLLNELTRTIEELQSRTAALAKAADEHVKGDTMAHAKHAFESVIPAMTAVRAAGDKLEGMVADDLWPLPTYQEMLFIK